MCGLSEKLRNNYRQSRKQPKVFILAILNCNEPREFFSNEEPKQHHQYISTRSGPIKQLFKELKNNKISAENNLLLRCGNVLTNKNEDFTK